MANQDQSVLVLPGCLSNREWMKRSEKHAEKFLKLLDLPSEKIANIGIYSTCFEEEFLIGQGSDGTCVFIGLSDDGKEVAVKRMLTHACKSLAENEKFILNMTKMEQSSHIVRYRYLKPGNPFTYLVLELCEETLVDYVKAHTKEELECRGPTIIREILTGLLALHGDGEQEKILHRDLKPSNILVGVEQHMRLADFGISKKVSKGKSTVLSGGKGSEYWRAVESVPNEEEPGKLVRYKRKSDVQVVGMLCYYILTKGEHPFGVEHERVKNLLEGNPVDLKKLSNPAAEDLVSWMLQNNIEDRPYVGEALKHPYLQSLEKQFNLLECFGNETEVKDRDTSCEVFRKLNTLPSSLPAAGWKEKIDRDVLNHMIGRRNYQEDMADLLRFIRNTSAHWRDSSTPETIQHIIHDPAEYFLERFPSLPVIIHKILRVQPKWKKRPKLMEYF